MDYISDIVEGDARTEVFRLRNQAIKELIMEGTYKDANEFLYAVERRWKAERMLRLEQKKYNQSPASNYHV